MRAQRIVSSVFTESLDVKKLVNTHFKINLLIDMLLTREQKFLFMHHRAKGTYPCQDDDKNYSVWALDEQVSDKSNRKKVLSSMNGFTIASQLDRKLLHGVLAAIPVC